VEWRIAPRTHLFVSGARASGVVGWLANLSDAQLVVVTASALFVLAAWPLLLLDDWAPRAAARELSGEEALAVLAERFAVSRGPVTDRDFARWAGIALADARRGLAAADGLTRRRFGGLEHWLSADEGDRIPAAGRTQAYLLAGFDEYLLGYKARDAVLDPVHSGKIAPGANGIFKPMIVVGGQIVGTWGRNVRGGELTLSLHPFAAASRLAGQVRREAARYRDFLGLHADAQQIVRVERPAI
jgi:hypothetical protein